MDENILDFRAAKDALQLEKEDDLYEFFMSQPPTLTPLQCTQSRELLLWSQEALAFRSGVSIKAIRQFEEGTREIRTVTKIALTFAIEAEGLIIIPGHEPLRGMNCRGSTQDPRRRDDYHLIE